MPSLSVRLALSIRPRAMTALSTGWERPRREVGMTEIEVLEFGIERVSFHGQIQLDEL